MSRLSSHVARRVLVQTLVDLRDLRDPLLALCVLERENLFVRPVEMERDVRYLLVQPL